MADDPDLRFLGFSLWVDRPQFPDAADYWDGNWLVVRVRKEAQGACIKCDGPILMTADIKQFRDKLAKMLKTLDGTAALEPLEPELKITLKMQSGGQVQATIEITPDHFSQRHHFAVEADQSYLPALIASRDDILARFPVVNTEKEV